MRATDTEIAEAYTRALAHAAGVGRRFPALAELALDAATDGVLWAAQHYNRAVGPFVAFAGAAVRRFVGRALHKAADKRRDKPTVGTITDDLAARETPAAGEVPLSATIRDLPDDERDAVRLFMLDGYNLRDCGFLLGCSPETVRTRLRQAAERLAPNAARPARGNGERRLSSVIGLARGR